MPLERRNPGGALRVASSRLGPQARREGPVVGQSALADPEIGFCAKSSSSGISLHERQRGVVQVRLFLRVPALPPAIAGVY